MLSASSPLFYCSLPFTSHIFLNATSRKKQTRISLDKDTQIPITPKATQIQTLKEVTTLTAISNLNTQNNKELQIIQTGTQPRNNFSNLLDKLTLSLDDIEYISRFPFYHIFYKVFWSAITSFPFQLLFLIQLLKRKMLFFDDLLVMRKGKMRHHCYLFFHCLLNSTLTKSILFGSFKQLLLHLKLLNFAGRSGPFLFFLDIQQSQKICSTDALLVRMKMPIQKRLPFSFFNFHS